nr:MAG: Histone-like Protein p6 [Bacteriophage sp.]
MTTTPIGVTILLQLTLQIIAQRKGEKTMRKPMVTRTIISTQVIAICVNPQTAETFEQEFTLTDKIADKDKALKRVSKQYNTDDCTIVAIRELKEVNELYGMDEADFIKGAKILDPTTRKVIEAEQTDAE